MNGFGERYYFGFFSGVLFVNFIKVNIDIEFYLGLLMLLWDIDGLFFMILVVEFSCDFFLELVVRMLILLYLNYDYLCYLVIQLVILFVFFLEIYDINRVYYIQNLNEVFLFDIVFVIVIISMV